MSIDVETTGLDVNRSRILSVAAVLFSHGRAVTEFYSLVRPEGFDLASPEAAEALRINGLRAEDIDAAPTLVELPIVELIGCRRVCVAHNARFDLAMLTNEWHRATGTWLRQPQLRLCTLALHRVLRPRAAHHTLTAVADDWNCGGGEYHHSLHDARRTGQILLKMAPELPDNEPWLSKQIEQAWLEHDQYIAARRAAREAPVG